MLSQGPPSRLATVSISQKNGRIFLPAATTRHSATVIITIPAFLFHSTSHAIPLNLLGICTDFLPVKGYTRILGVDVPHLKNLSYLSQGRHELLSPAPRVLPRVTGTLSQPAPRPFPVAVIVARQRPPGVPSPPSSLVFPDVILPFSGHLSCWTSPPSSAPIASPSLSSSAFFLTPFLSLFFYFFLLFSSLSAASQSRVSGARHTPRHNYPLCSV